MHPDSLKKQPSPVGSSTPKKWPSLPDVVAYMVANMLAYVQAYMLAYMLADMYKYVRAHILAIKLADVPAYMVACTLAERIAFIIPYMLAYMQAYVQQVNLYASSMLPCIHTC